MGIRGKLRKLWKLDIPKFIYYNFIAKNVKRDKGCYILPIKGTCVSIHKSAKIELHGTLTFNDYKFKGSKAECHFYIGDDATLTINGPVSFKYSTHILVHNGGHLTIGSLRANCGCVISCESNSTIGHRVRMARYVFMYDGDRHPILNAEGKRINNPKRIVIEDDVWLGLKTTVLKGSTIHAGTVIGANSLVSGEIPGGVIVATIPARPVIKDIDYSGTRTYA